MASDGGGKLGSGDPATQRIRFDHDNSNISDLLEGALDAFYERVDIRLSSMETRLTEQSSVLARRRSGSHIFSAKDTATARAVVSHTSSKESSLVLSPRPPSPAPVHYPGSGHGGALGPGYQAHNLSHQAALPSQQAVFSKNMLHHSFSSINSDALKSPSGKMKGPSVSMSRVGTVSYNRPKEEKTWAERFVKRGRFEVFFGLVILANAVFIGVQTDLEAQLGTFDTSTAMRAVSATFTVIFLIELLFRMAAEGLSFLWSSPSVIWNWIDLLIVLSSLLELGTTIFISVGSVGQFRILRIIRITRLLKVVRITRIIRFIRALRTMVHQLISTLRSLMWAMIVLALIIYVFAILMTQTFTEYLRDPPEQMPQNLEHYWSSVPTSMLSLFMSVTGGVSWEDVLYPLQEVGPFSVFLVLLYVSFTQLAVLNVLTGVFCQSAIESANKDTELLLHSLIDQKSIYSERIKSFFQDLDITGEGLVTLEEFEERMSDSKVKAYFEALELDTSDIRSLFHVMELEPGAQEIYLEEFVEGCLRLKGGASNLALAKLTRSQELLMRRFKYQSKRLEDMLIHLSMVIDYTNHAASGKGDGAPAAAASRFANSLLLSPTPTDVHERRGSSDSFDNAFPSLGLGGLFNASNGASPLPSPVPSSIVPGSKFPVSRESSLATSARLRLPSESQQSCHTQGSADEERDEVTSQDDASTPRVPSTRDIVAM